MPTRKSRAGGGNGSRRGGNGGGGGGSKPDDDRPVFSDIAHLAVDSVAYALTLRQSVPEKDSSGEKKKNGLHPKQECMKKLCLENLESVYSIEDEREKLLHEIHVVTGNLEEAINIGEEIERDTNVVKERQKTLKMALEYETEKETTMTNMITNHHKEKSKLEKKIMNLEMEANFLERILKEEIDVAAYDMRSEIVFADHESITSSEQQRKNNKGIYNNSPYTDLWVHNGSYQVQCNYDAKKGLKKAWSCCAKNEKKAKPCTLKRKGKKLPSGVPYFMQGPQQGTENNNNNHSMMNSSNQFFDYSTSMTQAAGYYDENINNSNFKAKIYDRRSVPHDHRKGIFLKDPVYYYEDDEALFLDESPRYDEYGSIIEPKRISQQVRRERPHSAPSASVVVPAYKQKPLQADYYGRHKNDFSTEYARDKTKGFKTNFRPLSATVGRRPLTMKGVNTTSMMSIDTFKSQFGDHGEPSYTPSKSYTQVKFAPGTLRVYHNKKGEFQYSSQSTTRHHRYPFSEGSSSILGGSNKSMITSMER